MGAKVSDHRDRVCRQVRLIYVTRLLLADGMYSFGKLLRYGYDAQPAARELIAAVLAHPRYHDIFITRWTGPPPGVTDRV